MDIDLVSLPRPLLQYLDSLCNGQCSGRGKVRRLEPEFCHSKLTVQLLVPSKLIAQVDGGFDLLLACQLTNNSRSWQGSQNHTIVNLSPPLQPSEVAQMVHHGVIVEKCEVETSPVIQRQLAIVVFFRHQLLQLGRLLRHRYCRKRSGFNAIWGHRGRRRRRRRRRRRH